MENVVTLANRKSTVAKAESVGIGFANVYELTAFLAGEIRSSKVTFTKLADKANCCPSTVSNIAHGITKDPRVGTVIKILDVLGYRVSVRT